MHFWSGLVGEYQNWYTCLHVRPHIRTRTKRKIPPIAEYALWWSIYIHSTAQSGAGDYRRTHPGISPERTR